MPLALLALLALASGARLQPAALVERTVRGAVHTSDGARVVGATLWVVGTRSPTDSSIAGTTDATGAYRFTLPVSETSELLVRRRGFADARVPIRGEGGSAKRPLTLDPVVVAPRFAPLVTALVLDTGAFVGHDARFYRNLASRRGEYLTRAELAARAAPTTSSALRGMRGITLERAAGGTFVRVRGFRCYASVWLDGTSMGTRAFDVDLISPASLTGVEVYAQSVAIPVEYQSLESSTCGVVAFWTRRGESDDEAIEAATIREPAGVRVAGDVDAPARLLDGSTFAPRYPSAPRAAGVGGRVLVELVVDTTGAVERSSLGIVALADPELAGAALRAAERLRFTPARGGGRPVRQLVHVAAQFQTSRPR